MTTTLEQVKNTANNLHHELVENGKSKNQLIELAFVWNENSQFLTITQAKGHICKVRDLLRIEYWIYDVDIVFYEVVDGEHFHSIVKFKDLVEDEEEGA